MMTEVFASFILAPSARGRYAATTRAADRGEAGKIGLPGGKLDAGESARDAALREAAEEGWLVVNCDYEPFHAAMVEGRPVAWFRADRAIALLDYEEQGRIAQIEASLAKIAESGYGNDAAVAALRALGATA